MATSSMTCPLPLTFRCTSDLIPKFLNPTDFAQILMQWDTYGQENGIKLDPSRLVSGFNDLHELRKNLCLHALAWLKC